jgi:superoxide dismutase, Fe-Mn family
MNPEIKNSRRSFLKKGALLSLLGLNAGAVGRVMASTSYDPYPPMESFAPVAGKYQLPALPYSYDAIEPYIDKETMEIHHSRHHQTYVDNLNKAIDGNAAAQALNLEGLCKEISKFPAAVRNNAGGHYNHSFFWNILSPDGGEKPGGKLGAAIENSFQSFDNFKTKFTEAALGHFGSGWAWLVSNKGKLEIGTTPNQDNPLMDVSSFRGIPVIGLDVWEHAYYLKHQNKRSDYIKAWWGAVNWQQAEKNYQESK